MTNANLEKARDGGSELDLGPMGDPAAALHSQLSASAKLRGKGGGLGGVAGKSSAPPLLAYNPAQPFIRFVASKKAEKPPSPSPDDGEVPSAVEEDGSPDADGDADPEANATNPTKTKSEELAPPSKRQRRAQDAEEASRNAAPHAPPSNVNAALGAPLALSHAVLVQVPAKENLFTFLSDQVVPKLAVPPPGHAWVIVSGWGHLRKVRVQDTEAVYDHKEASLLSITGKLSLDSRSATHELRAAFRAHGDVGALVGGTLLRASAGKTDGVSLTLALARCL